MPRNGILNETKLLKNGKLANPGFLEVSYWRATPKRKPSATENDDCTISFGEHCRARAISRDGFSGERGAKSDIRIGDGQYIFAPRKCADLRRDAGHRGHRAVRESFRQFPARRRGGLMTGMPLFFVLVKSPPGWSRAMPPGDALPRANLLANENDAVS